MSAGKDWRNYCSPVQDQGDCGSCTAFGTIGAWEPVYRIAENDPSDPIKLSERDLFSCAGGTCENGDTPENVLDQAKVGVCLESCDPYGTMYDGTDASCGEGRCADPSAGEKQLASWSSVTSVAQMKSLLNSGPLASTMTVHQSFVNYVSGVYHSLGANDAALGGHMIAIVGYDDSQQAWLLRNSWGTGWGMAGYCWIAYGDSDIDSEMYQLVPSLSPAPPPTPPAPVSPNTVTFTSLAQSSFGGIPTELVGCQINDYPQTLDFAIYAVLKNEQNQTVDVGTCQVVGFSSDNQPPVSTIPLSSISYGTYAMSVFAVTTDGRPCSEAVSGTYTYSPSLWQRLFGCKKTPTHVGTKRTGQPVLPSHESS